MYPNLLTRTVYSNNQADYRDEMEPLSESSGINLTDHFGHLCK